MPQSSTPSAAVTEDGRYVEDCLICHNLPSPSMTPEDEDTNKNERIKSDGSSEVLPSYLASHSSVTDRLATGVQAQDVTTSREKTKAYLKEWQRDWDRCTPKEEKKQS